MAEGRRPGGLTALAVLNFVFGGLLVLGRGLATVAIPFAPSQMTPEQLAKWPGESVAFLLYGIGLVSAGLLITAGVGYLKQKRVLGRLIGNGYAACSLVHTVAWLAIGRDEFGVLTMIGLIYPLLTLFLLNATFKDDLVN